MNEAVVFQSLSEGIAEYEEKKMKWLFAIPHLPLFFYPNNSLHQSCLSELLQTLSIKVDTVVTECYEVIKLILMRSMYLFYFFH